MYRLWLSLFLHPSHPVNGVATSRPRFGYGPALEPRRFQLRGERQRGSVMGSCWEVAPCPARGPGVGCEGFCKHGAGSSPPRLRGSRGQRGRHSLFRPTAPPRTVRAGAAARLVPALGALAATVRPSPTWGGTKGLGGAPWDHTWRSWRGLRPCVGPAVHPLVFPAVPCGVPAGCSGAGTSLLHPGLVCAPQEGAHSHSPHG